MTDHPRGGHGRSAEARAGFRTLKAFNSLRREPFVVFMEPPAVDKRILHQLALFSLMSRPSVRLDEWLEHHPKLCRRVRIPAAAKWEIRDKLDQANVNERVLFPGLDGISRWLARYYTPTAPPNADQAPRCHATRHARDASRHRPDRDAATR